MKINTKDTDILKLEKTTDLRFVLKDGQRILQQKVFVVRQNGRWAEWHDVPLEVIEG